MQSDFSTLKDCRYFSILVQNTFLSFSLKSAARIWHSKVVRARLVALECHFANTLSSVIVCRRGSRYSDVQLFIYAQVHSASVMLRAELRFSSLIWDHSTREYRITRALGALLHVIFLQLRYVYVVRYRSCTYFCSLWTIVQCNWIMLKLHFYRNRISDETRIFKQLQTSLFRSLCSILIFVYSWSIH